jgi:hypothetical protein
MVDRNAVFGIQCAKPTDGLLRFRGPIGSTHFLFDDRLWFSGNGRYGSCTLFRNRRCCHQQSRSQFQITKTPVQLRLLRLFLGFSAFAWGVSAAGVFVSWQEAEKLLEGLGAKPIAYDPMLDYWLRMAAGAFALVGLWYLLLALWPKKFSVAVPWFGVLMLLEGLILLVHGLRLSLPPFPFYGDVSACFIAGSGIVLCSRRMNQS